MWQHRWLRAGVNYALSHLNFNPDWCGDTDDGSGTYKESRVELPDVNGEFYITFNPANEYSSFNNLRKNIEEVRGLEPYGTIPAFTAEIIVRGEANDQVKYVRAVMIRGDFMGSHMSTEGSFYVNDATGYNDPGVSDDTNGLIMTNSSGNPSVYVPTQVPIDLHEGEIVSCGIAEIQNYDPNQTKIVDNSPPEEIGKIPVAQIINNKPTDPDDICELQPGTYTVKRELGPDNYYDYYIEYEGGSYDASEWAEFDSQGNLIIKKNIYIPEDGVTPMILNFDYQVSDLVSSLEDMNIYGENKIPLLVKILDIPVACASQINMGDRFEGGANPTPTPADVPDPTPTIAPEPGEAPPGNLEPKIIFDVETEYPHILYSDSDLDFQGRLVGIGGIVNSKKTSFIGDDGNILVLNEDDVNIYINPHKDFNGNGFVYSDDDIYVVMTNEDEVSGDWNFGGYFVSRNCNSDDINPHNSVDTSSMYMDLPDKNINFGRYINYVPLDMIAGYDFPVKLASWHEL